MSEGTRHLRIGSRATLERRSLHSLGLSLLPNTRAVAHVMLGAADRTRAVGAAFVPSSKVIDPQSHLHSRVSWTS